MSIFHSEQELDKYVRHLLGESTIEEAREFTYAVEKDRQYKTDKERREMVRKLRVVEAEENELREQGKTAEADKKRREAQAIIDALFYEVELVIYSLADALTSGPHSKRSGNASSAYVHNTEEDLKAVGVKEFIRVIEGGTITDKKGTRKTGFDPDGPGTFVSFVAKCVEGVMKNCHKKEAKHRVEISLDAPRGDQDEEEKDTNLYNNVFADSSLRFDAIGEDQYEKFLQSEAFEVVMDCLNDVTQNKRDIEVLKHYYGVDGFEKLTPTQIGEKYGFSKQRANNIVNNMIAKLQNYFSDDRRVMNASNDDDQRYLLKVGDKFASSPLSKLTDNPNMAGVIHGNGELEAIKNYWASKTSENLEEIKWEDREKVLKECGEEGQIASPESSLNGLTLSQARKKIFGLFNYSKIYDDQYWIPVNDFFKALSNEGICFDIIKTEYAQNADGNPSGKTWFLEFPFKNQNDKIVSIYGTVTASGCGTVEVPLSKYDLCFQVQ